ncbi:hypothetical protein LPJ61_001493 [Coemansia biformis]|uniref:Uncharacterized protein n=1 Tax=Coemansia biformis TaxID=1286918 RepID=A0A9W7YE82_9FUNG|nr:hypothetical protein LPJ61_001493 [Coemansia biformis]
MTLTASAAKYGPLAKERERLKQEERSGKRPKIDQQQWSQPQSAGPPKNINDVNAAHEAPATAVGGSAGPSNAAAGASATAAPKAAGNTVPARAAGGQVPKAGSIPAGSAAKSSAPARKAPKGALGGDRADTVVDSAAKSLAVGLGSIALASIAAHMVSFF